MANSLLDIGVNTQIFYATPNWTSNPSGGFTSLVRHLTQYQGTVQSLIKMSDHAPVSWRAEYITINKEDESTMLDFIHDHLGEAKRFWCRHPSTFFGLKTLASSGDAVVRVIPNKFDLVFLGHERVIIELHDGSLITRQIADAELDEESDEIVLTFNSVLAQDITPESVAFFGRLFLVRFDQEQFNQNILSEQVSEWSLKFTELVDEYGDTDL